MTALMTPARIVSARLGWGGGAEEEAAALVARWLPRPLMPAEAIDAAPASEATLQRPRQNRLLRKQPSLAAAAPGRTRELPLIQRLRRSTSSQ